MALLLSVFASIGAMSASSRSASTRPRVEWNPKNAASYLDGRMGWWLTWPNSQRDHGTSCVSCHTALPYALARASLRESLSESDATAPERQMLDNVVKRVRMWREVDPFYPDQTRGLPKTSESRGTEAILNAVILSRRDRAAGTLSADTRLALDNMWALQFRAGSLKGGWAWLNFHNEPWEANTSPYFGASLAALAVGSAPEAYAESPDAREGVALLAGYLQRNADSVNLLDRTVALWASNALRGSLPDAKRTEIADSLLATQRADGGWSLARLGTYARSDKTPVDTASDGYATAIATLALTTMSSARHREATARGQDWLRAHQDPVTGAWPSTSLNKARDPRSDVGKFMSDAATAYAVMALAPTHY